MGRSIADVKQKVNSMTEPFSLSGWMQNLAGKWLNEAEPVVHKKLSPQQQSHQLEIENSLLVLTAAVIRCDRNFDHNTEQTVLLFFDRQFGASRKVYRLNNIQQHLEMGTEPFTKIACTQLKLLTTAPSLRLLLEFLFQVAHADQYVQAKELRCLKRIAGYFGIGEDVFSDIKNRFQADHSHYATLGISPEATLEQAIAAYRKLALKYHPDRIQNETDFTEANIRFLAIQQAIEFIRKEKGKL
jgi:DnaJ like chaperone protein